MKKLYFAIGALVVLALVGLWILLTNGDGSDPSQREAAITVYETEVDGPDECSSLEIYDAENGVCRFECANEQECIEIENAINDEFDEYTSELESPDRSNSEKSNASEFVASYSVKNEQIKLTSGDDRSEFRDLWKEVANLSPDSISDSYIEEFVVYEEADDDTLAFVADDDGNGKWRYGVNYSTHSQSTRSEQKSTLIHEIAHIITLNSSQITQDQNCNTYKTDEGCAVQSSYLNAFVSKFWQTREQAAFDRSKFVTDYATTNPEEDMAESFAFFVFETKPSPQNIRDQKLAFFYDYDELSKTRQAMRSTLSQLVVRSKLEQR